MLTLAVQLPLFLWIVLGSADIEKLRQTPSDLYSLQAVSNINNWLQVAQWSVYEYLLIATCQCLV